MTAYPELNEPTFVRLADIQLALLAVARAIPAETPDDLVAAIDDTIAEGALPPRVVDLLKKIWNAGDDAPAALKVLGARLAQWSAEARQMDIGQNGDAARMRLALLRELDVPGTWPEPDADPARGTEAAPALPDMAAPVPPAPTAE